MWETGICGAALGGWLWIIPLAFMGLCFFMMFLWHGKGTKMGCMDRGDRVETERHAGELLEDTARRRYAAGEIDREEFQHIISDLTR